MPDFSYFKTKKSPEEQDASLTPEPEELQLLEQLQASCNDLERYLHASPTNPPCFLTRALIAGSEKDSAVFSMAEAIPLDAMAIKNNVNKAALPLLNCLRSFIDAYWKR